MGRSTFLGQKLGYFFCLFQTKTLGNHKTGIYGSLCRAKLLSSGLSYISLSFMGGKSFQAIFGKF